MQNVPIHILLANSQPIVRSGLRFLLEQEPEFRVIAEAANGREALVLTDYKHPEIVLLDMNLSPVNGIDVAKQISANGSRSKSIFVTAHMDEGYVAEAFRAGACGYVAEDAAPGDLPRAIRVVAQDQHFLSPTISARLLDSHLSKGNISEYERELWCLVAAAYQEDEIATILKTDATKVKADLKSLAGVFCRNTLPEVLTRA